MSLVNFQQFFYIFLNFWTCIFFKFVMEKKTYISTFPTRTLQAWPLVGSKAQPQPGPQGWASQFGHHYSHIASNSQNYNLVVTFKQRQKSLLLYPRILGPNFQLNCAHVQHTSSCIKILQNYYITIVTCDKVNVFSITSFFNLVCFSGKRHS